MNENYQKITDWLKDKHKILAVTHKSPDGDAIGSLFGLAHLLSNNGKNVHIYLEDELPSIYQTMQFLTELKSKRYIGKQVDINSYDGIIILDSATKEVISYTNIIENAEKHKIPTCSIDHHIDNTKYAALNIIESKSAAAEIVAAFGIDQSLNITKYAAECFLLGIIRDTGGFRFANTSSETLHMTAKLLELGADYQKIIQDVFFSEPLNKLKFISFVISNKLQFAENGRVVFIVLEDDDFRDFNLTKRDMEGLIDSIRVIEGVKLSCIFTSWKDVIKLSIRSCDEKYPANQIAAQFKGGGHLLAAGGRVENSSFSQVVQKFLNITRVMFNG